MIVVSNTSPLTNLAAIGHFDLLKALFNKVHISTGVLNELNLNDIQWPGSKETTAAKWIEIHSLPENDPLVSTLQRDLDKGEAETIALALILKADLVLLDEREGRHAAQRLGLKTLGVIGLLIRAKETGEIKEISTLLNLLRSEAGFFISDELYRYAIELGGEHIP